jgi:hypothetical protein
MIYTATWDAQIWAVHHCTRPIQYVHCGRVAPQISKVYSSRLDSQTVSRNCRHCQSLSALSVPVDFSRDTNTRRLPSLVENLHWGLVERMRFDTSSYFLSTVPLAIDRMDPLNKHASVPCADNRLSCKDVERNDLNLSVCQRIVCVESHAPRSFSRKESGTLQCFICKISMITLRQPRI